MALTVGELTAYLGANTTQFNSKLDQAEARFASTGTRLNKTGMSLGGVGSNLTKYVSLPIAAVGVASLVMASKFDSAMNLIQTQAGGSAKDVKFLSTAVLNMKNVQHSPAQLADALYHLKSVGMDNVTAMKALTATEQLASVGHADLEATTNAVAGAYKSGIAGASNFGNAVASINAIIGAGNLRMDDLNAAMGTGFMVSAHQAGVSLNDVGAALAMMTSRGIPATRAATALKMAMSAMEAPTNAMAKVMDDLHMKTDDLSNAMRTGGLPAAMALLAKHMTGLSKGEKAADLTKMFGARSSQAILTLIGNLKDFNRVEEQVNANATKKKFMSAYAVESQENEAKWHTFLSTMQRDAVKLGNTMLPAVTELAADLGHVANALDNLTPTEKAWGLRLIVLAAAAGPVIKGVLLMVKAYEGLKGILITTTAAQAALDIAQAGGGASGAVSGVGGVAAGASRDYGVMSAFKTMGPAAAGAGGAETAAVGASIGAGAVAAMVAGGALIGGAIGMAVSVPLEKAIGGWASNSKSAAAERKAFSSSTGASMRLQQAKPSSQADLAGVSILPTVQKMTVELNTPGNSAARIVSLIKQIATLKAAAKDPIMAGEINAKPTMASARDLRDNLMAQFDITRKQANHIVKDLLHVKVTDYVTPQMTAMQKKVASQTALASSNVGANMQKIRSALAQHLKGPDISSVISALDRIISECGGVTSAAGRAAARLATVAVTGRNNLSPTAEGTIAYSPQARLIGEAGPEVVVPMASSKRARAHQLLLDSGLMSSMARGGVVGRSRSGISSTTSGTTYVVQVVMPGGTTLVGTAHQVGQILAPHVKEAIEKIEARQGRGR